MSDPEAPKPPENKESLADIDSKSELLRLTQTLLGSTEEAMRMNRGFNRYIGKTDDGKNVSILINYDLPKDKLHWTCAVREIVNGQQLETKYYLYRDMEKDFPFEKHTRTDDLASLAKDWQAVPEKFDVDNLKEFAKQQGADEQARHDLDKALGLEPVVTQAEADSLIELLKKLPPED